ncbi:LOW QUALITY PROTEIN: beta-glucosidase 12 [Nicotiana tabacum]|uniref:LOW QUALITY PROTEIN: beta-glucosidase 12 n=1 Tax=Nicotiana tabacum TaxID=4097 RepID=A0AC58SPJ6_TOBAC
MAIKGSLVIAAELAFLCTFAIFANCIASTSINRNSFPDGFLIGASSSAYQYEGAAYEDGKGPSIWDTFTHKFPGKISEGSNGDVGDNFYHMYKDDVKLMKFVGLDAFRFSISWSRILPRGKLSGGVNKEGIAFYNNLINELLSNGIQPFVTIYHWDLPQTLEDEYSGFLSPLVVNDFVDFAELCFKEFGDRVKHWITMNEPYNFENPACANGNSATEPYVVAHHLLLCHATTVSLYKEKYQESQMGEIGITLVSQWLVPYSNSELDVKAAQRYIDFMYGWFMDPLVYGNYPSIMRTIVGERLPNFTAEQAKMMKGSFDFIGLNYYTSNYAAHLPATNNFNVSSATDPHVHVTGERDGVPIGDPTAVSFFFGYPKGLRDLLVYTKEKYNDPPIYITETGMADRKIAMKDAIKDRQRVNFYRGHLLAVQEAIELGVKINGFFAWSFLDTFEWTDGYKLRFGMCYVDYTDGLKRYPKYSALWFRKHFHKESFKLHYPRRMSSWIPRILRSYM